MFCCMVGCRHANIVQVSFVQAPHASVHPRACSSHCLAAKIADVRLLHLLHTLTICSHNTPFFLAAKQCMMCPMPSCMSVHLYQCRAVSHSLRRMNQHGAALPVRLLAVQFCGACLDRDNLMMVTELMQCDLHTAFTRPDRAPQLSWYRQGRSVVLDIAKGLHHLHQSPRAVVHFDLKASPLHAELMRARLVRNL